MTVKKGLTIPDNAELVPIAGRVAIHVQSVREAMYGNLYLPQQSAGDQHVGVISHVYDPYLDDYGNRIEPMVKVGDIVVIGKYTGTSVQLNRDEFIICRETDILACMREKTPKLEVVDDD